MIWTAQDTPVNPTLINTGYVRRLGGSDKPDYHPVYTRL